MKAQKRRPTRKPSDERPELLLIVPVAEPAEKSLDPPARLGGRRTGQAGCTLFDVLGRKVLGEGGIEAGLQEGEEEVEDVNCEGVADDVPLVRVSEMTSDAWRLQGCTSGAHLNGARMGDRER